MSELTQELEISREKSVVAQTQPLWAHLLIEELIRQGVGVFVIASGSRNSPLVLAVAENQNAQHLMHFDERGGAFAALGFARATGRPAAWITTSGTAVANGLPAVVEADADGVPLIMLTADRPPELRDTGANQTIRQPGIFGPYLRWQFDMPVPDPAIDPAFVLTTAGQAVYRSKCPAGPVHINCQYREPLAPDEREPLAVPAGLVAWKNGTNPYTRYPISHPAVGGEEIEALAFRFGAVERGIVILGKSDDARDAAAGAAVAQSLGWPLFADVVSGACLNAPSAVSYDLLLGSDQFCAAHQAEAILHLGGRVTSKRLQRYIRLSNPSDYIVVRPTADRYDPSHCVTDRIQSSVAGFCNSMMQLVPARGDSTWLVAWKSTSDTVEEAVDTSLASGELCEPAVARTISRATPENHGLVLASSMPIRDMDAFAVRNGPRLRVTANRGASGIDGTVATAAGFARGLDKPTTLLIGDLALLHDLNSLVLLRDGPPVTVVVANNDGGGIFSFLPIVEREEVFEAYFGTPHGIGFMNAAAMFGLGYAQPRDLKEFETAYEKAMSGAESGVIEVRTTREENAALHRELNDLVVDAVNATLPK